MMFFFILLQYLILSIKILYCKDEIDDIYNINQLCKNDMIKNFNHRTYLNDSNQFLLEIMRGKIPFKIEDTSLKNFDFNFIKRINKNIPCLYSYKNINHKSNKTNGLFLGAGINLFNYNEEELTTIIRNSDIKEKGPYLKLIQDLKIYRYQTLAFPEYNTTFKDIDKFNIAVLNYTIDKYIKQYKDNKLYKTTIINGILSLYFQIYQGDSDLKRYLDYNPTQLSYVVEYFFETSPYVRLIQSKLILMLDGNIKYNNNHIFIVVPLFLFDENELKAIKELINTLCSNINNNNLNANRISILAIKENNNYSNYIINYNSKKDILDNLFKIEYKNETDYIDLDNIYENLNKQFNKNINANVYENKIAILILNYYSTINNTDKIDDIVENYKKRYSIQTIPIINTKELKENNYKKDIFKYNIFYNFTEFNYLAPLRMAISNMHITLDMTNKSEGKINNLNLNDIDVPMYIEVYISEAEKETEYYEISLKIDKTSGYNIFISDSNPYPNIKNNYSNFLKYENNYNPILRIKSFNISKFYIGIEGILSFNILITKKYANEIDFKNLNLSEGDYKNIMYNTQIQLKDKHLPLQTFVINDNGDYKIYSNIYKNISIENIMKYYSRGLDLDNTDDHTFFNYEFFIYLFGQTHLINRVYKEQNTYDYYFGRYIKISDFSPLDLQIFNRLTINKLYPFLKINDLLTESAPPIIFNKDELRIIYNITYSRYITELSNILKRYKNVIQFENQRPTMKFALFYLYFSYYYDSKIIKNIINLSSNQPKYSEVLQYLKEKKQDCDTFLINYIMQIEQQDKLEKTMVSVIMGRSLLLSDISPIFVKEFYNIMSKSRTKIALSMYDTLKSVNMITNIISFSSTHNNNPDEIYNYKNVSSNERKKYNNSEEQNMDFEKIINFGLSQYSKYDNGIKKRLIIICDENINNDKYIINNKLINLNNNKHTELIDNQIDLIIMTTKNFEKGEIHELFNAKLENHNEIPYSLYDNYFHVKNLSKTDEYLNGLNRMIKASIVKINVRERFINDYYQGKMSYYEINFKENPKDVIVIKTDIKKFNFYTSLTYPFPNPYIGDLRETDDPDYISFSYQDSNGSVYLGLEPKSSVQKQIIEIFTCESFAPNEKCKFVGSSKDEWFLMFFVLFGFILLFIIYKCRVKLSSDLSSKDIKRLNVFDTVK